MPENSPDTSTPLCPEDMPPEQPGGPESVSALEEAIKDAVSRLTPPEVRRAIRRVLTFYGLLPVTPVITAPDPGIVLATRRPTFTIKPPIIGSGFTYHFTLSTLDGAGNATPVGPPVPFTPTAPPFDFRFPPGPPYDLLPGTDYQLEVRPDGSPPNKPAYLTFSF